MMILSHVLGDLYKAFGVKRRVTQYYKHPIGHALIWNVKNFFYFLSCLRHLLTDWRTMKNICNCSYLSIEPPNTPLPDHHLLFGPLRIPILPDTVIPDPSEYCTTLKKKLYDLRGLVDANVVYSAEHQCSFYKSSQ